MPKPNMSKAHVPEYCKFKRIVRHPFVQCLQKAMIKEVKILLQNGDEEEAFQRQKYYMRIIEDWKEMLRTSKDS